MNSQCVENVNDEPREEGDVLGVILGTLSSGSAEGDGDAETCEKTGERTYDSFPDSNFDDFDDDEHLPEFRVHKRDLPVLAELCNEVNKLLISRCLFYQTVATIQYADWKDLSRSLTLRLKMKTGTQVLMVSTLLNALEFYHNINYLTFDFS